MRIVAGEAKGRRIETSPGRNTRPTLERVRESLFDILQFEIPGSTVLDLFSGSGAIGLEALSRGARKAVLVDHSPVANRVEKKNIISMRMQDRAETVLSDWKTALGRFTERKIVFDLVFMDPPYEMKDLREVFERLIPVVSGHTIVILEHESGADPQTYTGYKQYDRRKWGYCAMSFYRLKTDAKEVP